MALMLDPVSRGPRKLDKEMTILDVLAISTPNVAHSGGRLGQIFEVVFRKQDLL